MCKQETVVNGIKTVIKGLSILTYAVDCYENGCQNCPAHMYKEIWINGERTYCMLRLPGLLKIVIDNCME